MNRGAFSRWITANTDAGVVEVEPVPAPFEAIPLPSLPRTTAFQNAIGSLSGSVALALDEGSCAALEGTGLGEASAQRATARAITLAEFLAQHGIEIVDPLKIDIEGVELDVLGDAPADVLRQCRQITCESRNFLDPTLTPKVRVVQRRLEMLGFTKMTFSLNDTDTLALQRDELRLSHMDLLAATVANKHGRGTLRRSRRLLGMKK